MNQRMMSNTKSLSSSKEVASNHWKVVQDMLKHEVLDKTPVCIHKIRPRVRATRPEAYTPQYISLGPYHNTREDLYEMLPYKVLAFKESQKAVSRNDQQEALHRRLVESLEDKSIIAQIRTSCDRILEEDTQYLASVVVLDSIFLLEFLREHMRGKSCLSDMKRTAHLVDPTQSAFHSILQDMIMLENQIPIFVLNYILQFCDIADEPDILRSMLLHTCKKLCPLKHGQNNPKKEITKYAHLLELLYYLIVPENREFKVDVETPPPVETKKPQERPRNNCVCPSNDVLCYNIKMASTIRFLTKARPFTVFFKIFSDGAACPDGLLSKQGEDDRKTPDPEKNNAGEGSSSSDKRAPKVDEIKIPTVSDLLSVGIECRRTDVPITGIKFNKNTQTLHLPRITINANTEVVIRNLVAYEAEAITGPLVLARYTELMSGIIDSAKDVELLRKREILVSYLKNDKDVADLWNSMSRCTRLSRGTSIDQAIREVNEAYDSNRRVKFNRFTKECMLSSWRVLMLLLAIVLMVLMVIQSFCDVYNCPRALAPVAAPPA